jgi:hypothetical protein
MAATTVLAYWESAICSVQIEVNDAPTDDTSRLSRGAPDVVRTPFSFQISLDYFVAANFPYGSRRPPA